MKLCLPREVHVNDVHVSISLLPYMYIHVMLGLGVVCTVHVHVCAGQIHVNCLVVWKLCRT